jgi:hypothetical protein
MSHVPHRRVHVVFLDAVEVDFAHLLGCALFVLLDAWSAKG